MLLTESQVLVGDQCEVIVPSESSLTHGHLLFILFTDSILYPNLPWLVEASLAQNPVRTVNPHPTPDQ